MEIIAAQRRLLQRDISMLKSRGFGVEVSNGYDWVCVYGVDLPGGGGGLWTDRYKRRTKKTPVWIDINYDYPLSPPGVSPRSHPSRAIHIPLVYYRGQMMSDLIKCKHDPWYWLCFKQISWDPLNDNLLTLVGLVEASISERIRKAGLW